MHELKCWPEPFEATVTGKKTHEVRSNIDRKFEVGDRLCLREWVPDEGIKDGYYTGRECVVEVTYISKGGTWKLPLSVDVLSVQIWAKGSL